MDAYYFDTSRFDVKKTASVLGAGFWVRVRFLVRVLGSG